MDDFLSMPDDELPEFAPEVTVPQESPVEGSQSAPALTGTEEEIQAQLEAQAATVADDDDEDVQTTTTEAGDDADDSEEEENPLAQPDDAVVAPKAKEAKAPEATEAEKDQAPEPATEASKTEKPAVVEASPADFQKAILAPFKANGREMQVKNADEAIRLMQMGANYNLKMAGLKPHLNLVRQLESAGLATPEAVANFIDIVKHKKPAAIAKLVKEAGIDPLDVSEEDIKGYAPTPELPDERREALEATLDGLQDKPNYKRVMKVIPEFDQTTKQVIGDNPQVIEYFEDHMTKGVFDIIDTEINRRKALGQIKSNTPYIQAYKQVGDELNEQGAFNSLVQAEQPATAPAKEAPAVPVKRVTAANPAKDAAVQEKRRAAAPTKATAPVKVDTSFNPLSMSDEEFEKHAQQHLKLMR